jgi:hypothetical protein
MNCPSLLNFTMRLFTCPSATKMSPFGPMATSATPLKACGPSRHTFCAERHQHLAAIGAHLVDHLAVALVGPAVGDPEVAVPIEADAVRPDKRSLSPRLDYLAGGRQLDDRWLGSREDEDGPLRIDRNVWHLTPLQGSCELSPAGHSFIGACRGELTPPHRVNRDKGNGDGNPARHSARTLKRHGNLPVDSLPPPAGRCEFRLRVRFKRTLI